MRFPNNIFPYLFWLVCLLAHLLIGCKNQTERRYLRENVSQLLDKEIIFPDTVTLLKGYDFYSIKTSSLLGRNYTIIKYVTADCPRCIHNLQLFQEEIADKLDTSFTKPMYIIFTDYLGQFTKNILPEIEYIQPLVLDTLNRFMLENDLPLFDARFHTFLLDSQNRILIIGDPTNQEIGKLYQRFVRFNDL